MTIKIALDFCKSNWKTIAIGLFMLFTTIKLFQIEANTEAIHDVEWNLSSVESEVNAIRRKLGR